MQITALERIVSFIAGIATIIFVIVIPLTNFLVSLQLSPYLNEILSINVENMDLPSRILILFIIQCILSYALASLVSKSLDKFLHAPIRAIIVMITSIIFAWITFYNITHILILENIHNLSWGWLILFIVALAFYIISFIFIRQKLTLRLPSRIQKGKTPQYFTGIGSTMFWQAACFIFVYVATII